MTSPGFGWGGFLIQGLYGKKCRCTITDNIRLTLKDNFAACLSYQAERHKLQN
jgi:hypothetical protein